MDDKRTEFFFIKTRWYPKSWHGFWHEYKEVMPTQKGTRLVIFNLGWKNYGFFYFKEELPQKCK
tara:strand:+ start:1444 stop:1635 length:192 start_codon:yes stop_codon:yes gene_type:complete